MHCSITKSLESAQLGSDDILTNVDSYTIENDNTDTLTRSVLVAVLYVAKQLLQKKLFCCLGFAIYFCKLTVLRIPEKLIHQGCT